MNTKLIQDMILENMETYNGIGFDCTVVDDAVWHSYWIHFHAYTSPYSNTSKLHVVGRRLNITLKVSYNDFTIEEAMGTLIAEVERSFIC